MTEFLASTTKVSEKNYVTIRVAAGRISYTTDYIGKLAREGTIDAVRNGRVWYVELNSLKFFELKAKAEKKKVQEALREERKLERVKARLPSYDVEQKLKAKDKKYLALLETATLAACITLVVFLFGVTTKERLELGDVQVAAVEIGTNWQEAIAWTEFSKLKNWFWLFKTETVKETVLVKETETVELISKESVVISERLEIPQFDKEKKLLLVDSRYQENLDDVFSDEVEIKFFDSRKGVVQPIFASGKGEPVSFLIDEKGQQNSN